jgi:hypothetical protein
LRTDRFAATKLFGVCLDGTEGDRRGNDYGG